MQASGIVLLRLAAQTLAAIALTAAAQAQASYPARPVTVIVPYAPGGPLDVLVRITGEHMGKTLGQAFIVENLVGAGGTVGTRRGARAAADGYTLNAGNLGSHAAGPAIYGAEQAGYDPRELDPIGVISSIPFYLVVRKDFPARTLQELVAYAKANPGRVTNAHAGVGGSAHLASMLLMMSTGMKMSLVPYRGTAPAMTDVVAGQVDSVCDTAPGVLPQLAAGNVRALVVAEPKRVSFSPDIPSAPEADAPDFLVTGWSAMYAPKGTPGPVLEKLRGALAAALQDAAVRKRIADLGGTIPTAEEMTEASLRAFMRTEVEKWAKVVREANIKPGSN